MANRVINGTVDGSNVITAGGAEVDPISRIEGHLGVKLVTDASGFVSEANVHGNLWRGFENFLLGRDPNDAITFTQRICGVCPLPHATASTFAVDAVNGYSDGYITFAYDGSKGVPAKAVLIRNLVYASEFLMSHITHFYHLAAPSYVQGPAMPPWTPYFAESYYNGLLTNKTAGRAVPTHAIDGTYSDDLWSTVIRSYVKALRIRRLTFEAGALFAGRMPMTSSFIAGGVTMQDTEDLSGKVTLFRQLMEEVGDFIVKELVPINLALGALYPEYDNAQDGTGGSGYGAGVGNFLAWGAFPQLDDTLAIGGGVWTGGQAGSLQFSVTNKADVTTATANNGSQAMIGDTGKVAANLKESISFARYANYNSEFDANGEAYPGAVTRTEPDRANGYSYLKAPRWGGNACEVGPFARMVVNGHYPVDGRTLAAVVPGYTAYVKNVADGTVDGVTGLDPKMIEPDIAVALVREGAATLQMWDGTTWTKVDNGTAGIDINTLDAATITAAYTGTSVYGDPVITDGPAIALVTYIYGLQGGLSTMDRLRGRAIEALVIVQMMIGAYDKANVDPWHNAGWIDDAALLSTAAGSSYRSIPVPTAAKSNFGVSEAPRGALAHFCSIDGGKISAYQCVVPTTWNAGPHDAAGARGPMEQAMIGIPFSDAGGEFTSQGNVTVNTQGGLEALRVAQSFDPCIACAVH